MGRIVGSDEVAVGHGEWLKVAMVDLSVREARTERRDVSSAQTWRLCLKVLFLGVVVAGAVGGIAYSRWAAYRDDVHCREYLRLIGLAWHAYFLDRGDKVPVSPLWPEQLARYLPPENKYWTCPKTGRPYEVASLYNALIGDTSALVWDAAAPKAPHRGRWYVLRVDGSVVASETPPQLGTTVEIPSAIRR